MPPVVNSPFGGETQAHAIEQAATKLLLVNVSTPFNLTLLNLGQTSSKSLPMLLIYGC